MKEIKGEDLARQLGNMVNIMCSEEGENFADAIMREHRTLQQEIAGVFLATFLRWAKCYRAGPEHYDLRNEATCIIADRIISVCEKLGVVFDGRVALPFI